MKPLRLLTTAALLAAAVVCRQRVEPTPTQRQAWQAIRAAHTFVDTLNVDPVALRDAGHKGKKHFVEALDAYARLWRVTAAPDRGPLTARINALARHTQRAAFHDMRTNTDEAFKQDATSYLRAAYVLDTLGWDTRDYRREIRAVLPRLNAHLPARGVHQRLALRRYYQHFGLPFPAEHIPPPSDGFAARRPPPEGLTLAQAYELTHEVFVPFDFGDNRAAPPFDEGERAWLGGALSHLTERYVARGNADVVAELLMCLTLLRLEHLPAFGNGLAFLLGAQNPDGSWGTPPRYGKPMDGTTLHITRLLHTTLVGMDALILAFGVEPRETG